MVSGICLRQDFTNHGFAAKQFTLHAPDYGSWADRCRNFFVGMRGDTPTNRARLQQTDAFMQMMKIGPSSAGDFILPKDKLLEWQNPTNYILASSSPGAVDVSAPKKQKQDCKYKDEHLKMFEHAELPWPPSFCEFALEIDFGGMSDRMKEVAVFVHTMFPVKPDIVGKWHACDINMSLGRLVGKPGSDDIRNPWSGNNLPTMVR